MPSNSLIFSNKVADIYHNPDDKKMTIIYHGLVNYGLLIEVIESINKVVEENGISGALVDLCKLHGSFHRLLGYMEETGFPLLIKHGLKFQAQIISDDIIMQNLSKKVEAMLVSLGVNANTFYNREEAEEWLDKALLKER